jgi:phage virion morphogenesis protein
MSGAQTSPVVFKIKGLEAIQDKLKALSELQFSELLDNLGSIVISQTQKRIESAGPAPDGKQWPEWSDNYAKTRHGNHALLQNEGYLKGSFEASVTGKNLSVGSNLVYAATHQYGDKDRGIPARTYLGLSDDNNDEVKSAVDDWLASVVQAA